MSEKETNNRLNQLQQIRNGGLSDHQQSLQRLKVEFARYVELTSLTPETALAPLMDVVKEAERLRRNEISGAERMERQAAASRSKADGYAMISSIVLNVVNRYIQGAEREIEERRMLEEREGREEDKKRGVSEEIAESPPKKKTNKRPRKKKAE